MELSLGWLRPAFTLHDANRPVRTQRWLTPCGRRPAVRATRSHPPWVQATGELCHAERLSRIRVSIGRCRSVPSGTHACLCQPVERRRDVGCTPRRIRAAAPAIDALVGRIAATLRTMCALMCPAGRLYRRGSRSITRREAMRRYPVSRWYTAYEQFIRPITARVV